MPKKSKVDSDEAAFERATGGSHAGVLDPHLTSYLSGELDMDVEGDAQEQDEPEAMTEIDQMRY